MRLLQPFFIALLLLPWSARAATLAPAAGQAMQVVAGLAVVLALIAAVTWLARRLQAFRPQGHGHIRIVEGLAVGAREKLLLIEVGDRRVLLGMCPGRIQTLASFSSEEAPVSFETALAAAAEEA